MAIDGVVASPTTTSGSTHPPDATGAGRVGFMTVLLVDVGRPNAPIQGDFEANRDSRIGHPTLMCGKPNHTEGAQRRPA